MSRTLLVGELNPYGDPALALYPLPPNASGGRLARILGLSARDYLRAFDRMNLCSGAWDEYRARARALTVMSDAAGGCWPEGVVLLGARVCGAFGLPYEPFRVTELLDAGRFAVLPHPSGLCRKWGEPDAVERARYTLAVLRTAPQKGSI